MNIEEKKYYEVWAYQTKNGLVDYTCRVNYLITSDEELKNKEEVSRILQEKKECSSDITDVIISWNEMCYQEFMESVEILVYMAG